MKSNKANNIIEFLTVKTPILSIAVTIIILVSVYLLAQNTYLYKYSNSTESLQLASINEIYIKLDKDTYFSEGQIPNQIIWYSSSYSMNYISELIEVNDSYCIYQVDTQDFKNEFGNSSTSTYDVKIMYANRKISLVEQVLKNEK